MRYHQQVTKNYNFTDEDVKNIHDLKLIMDRYQDEFIFMFEKLLTTSFQYPEDLPKEIITRHSSKMVVWFNKFFDGNITNDYINFLTGIGLSHYKNKIDPSNVSGAFSHIRKWMHEKIFQNFENDIKRKDLLVSMHKMMDLNYDILSSAYNEELLKKYSHIFSIRNFVVGLSERFSTLMHIILSAVLMVLTLGATFLFGKDMVRMLGEHSDHLMISALGSLLIIWVLLELLHTEIQMIKGGKFKISVFVGVAMIAFVRDLLITTLKHDQNSQFSYFFLASIVGLGLIYWLISYTERSDFGRTNQK